MDLNEKIHKLFFIYFKTGYLHSGDHMSSLGFKIYIDFMTRVLAILVHGCLNKNQSMLKIFSGYFLYLYTQEATKPRKIAHFRVRYLFLLS